MLRWFFCWAGETFVAGDLETIIPALEEFLQVGGGPSIQAYTMRKLALADYFLATLAVGIVIGFPVWHWIVALL